jgi:hypothetical protein
MKWLDITTIFCMLNHNKLCTGVKWPLTSFPGSGVSFWTRQLIEGVNRNLHGIGLHFIGDPSPVLSSQGLSPEIQSLLLILSCATIFSFHPAGNGSEYNDDPLCGFTIIEKDNPLTGQLFRITPSTGYDVIILLIFLKNR